MPGGQNNPMTYDEFNQFCASLPATHHVVQWGGSYVWKVGVAGDPKRSKVFAIGGWEKDHEAVTFKVSEIAYEVLKDQPGLRPAPYLASRGMKWIQHYAEPGLSDTELQEHIRASHRLVSRNLTKKVRNELGLG